MIHECFRLASHTQMLSNAKVLDIIYVKSCSSDSDMLGAAIIRTHRPLHAIIYRQVSCTCAIMLCGYVSSIIVNIKLHLITF
jgi:hypothetical protein